MPIQAKTRKLYGAFKFTVKIDGFSSAGFQEMSPIAINVEAMDYFEGGALVPFREPGLGSVENLTLSRGMSQDLDMYNWMMDVLDIMAKVPEGTSAPPPQYLKNLVVHQRERDDAPAVDFPVYWAFPTKYVGGPWNNAESSVTMEQLELAYHHPDRVNLGSQ